MKEILYFCLDDLGAGLKSDTITIKTNLLTYLLQKNNQQVVWSFDMIKPKNTKIYSEYEKSKGSTK